MTIKVKDAVKEAAYCVGLGEEVEKYLGNTATSVGEQATKLMLRCFQRIENELALDYLPLLTEDEVVTPTGVVPYATLNKPAARIFCVENEWGESLKYKLYPDRLITSAGKVKIVYAYSPAEKNLEGTSEYDTIVSQRILVYGMAAEYSLAVGELTAAREWDKKYKEGVQAAYKAAPCKRLRSRRWI